MFNNIQPNIMEAYERFWERRNKGRPILHFSFPKEGASPPPTPVSLEEQWLDGEYLVASYKHSLQNIGYIAEGVSAHFEEFVLPDLVCQANHMERSVYHLDGVGELPHLDMILDIEGIGGIQWVPGAGQESMCHPKWFDIYRRIQDKKKNLVISHGINENDAAGVEKFIKSIDPAGAYICAYFSSRAKAEDMMEKITRWSE